MRLDPPVDRRVASDQAGFLYPNRGGGSQDVMGQSMRLNCPGVAEVRLRVNNFALEPRRVSDRVLAIVLDDSNPRKTHESEY